MARSNTMAQHSFASLPAPQVQRSKFNRSCGLKTTFNEGKLVPIFVDEVLPGDTMQMRMTTFGRLSTLLHPVMENLFLDYFFFFVPNRLVWDNWVKQQGEQKDPGDSVDFLVPQIVNGSWAADSVADYFGLPTSVAIDVSALPFRAYNLIWNEWFRSEDLQDSVLVKTDDGPDLPSDYALLNRNKRHDYFTSCLPWPQKFTPPPLPLGISAPVVPDGTVSPTLRSSGSAGPHKLQAKVGAADTASWSPASTFTGQDMYWVTPGLKADLLAATAATINQLRETVQIQKLYERDARGGTRYTEILRSHFGVVSPDARLQRPEFLGGGTSRISVNQVASTTYNTGNTLQLGDLGAFGTTTGQAGFVKSFVEHGFVIGLVASRSDLNYQNGVERMWSRLRRLDHYLPTLAHLGEQAVLNKEIYADGSATDELAFGYQERWAEYRYKPSRVTARMRSTGAAPLDSWHLSQDFNELPVLNSSFIVEAPPLARILAVSPAVEPPFLLDCFFEYECTRPLPVYSVPGMMDHF